MQDAQALRVVYVMGAGHSGSSLLGVVLGNCQDFFYAGELEEWLAKGGVSRWGGEARTRFWETVRERVGEPPAELRGARASRYIERSSALLRVDGWATRRRLLGPYRRLQGELLRAIAQTSGAANIVDTSHFPLRARELAKVEGVDLHLVFLVRDAQSVVASHVHGISPHEVPERRARVLTSNAGLWLTLLVSVIVFLRHPRERRTFLRHEQLLADPERVLRELLERLGSHAPPPDLDALDVGLPLEGNRMLTGGTIALARSRSRPRRWSLLTAVLQWPWRLVLTRMQPAIAPAEQPASRGESTRLAR
ncbi:MAG TPA: sulfotransferase [Solirubrobacteraceae bacterium]|nr:sulfotransferase [Solirubrobacteraceae bacterium]